MRTKTGDGKGVKKSQILESEINMQRDKLKKMEEEYKEQKRQELEKNQKMIAQLIKLEKLDSVPVETWRQAIPEIKNALNGGQTGLSAAVAVSEAD